MTPFIQIQNIANAPEAIVGFLEGLISAIAHADYGAVCAKVSPHALITIHQTTYGREAWFHSYTMPQNESVIHQGTQGSVEHYTSPAAKTHVVSASFMTWGGDMIDAQSGLITFVIVGDFGKLSVISIHTSVELEELPAAELRTSGFRFIQGKIVSVNSSGPIVNIYIQDAKGRYWVRMTESQYLNLNLGKANNVAVWGSTVWVPQRNGKKGNGVVEATVLNYVRVIDWKD